MFASIHKFFTKFLSLFIVFRFCSPLAVLKSILTLTGVRPLPPPFIHVTGMFNLRRVSKGNRTLLFRSGDPSHITVSGKRKLLNLGVRAIFDFRAEVEGGVKAKTISNDGNKQVKEWEEVKIVHVPIADAEWAKSEADSEGKYVRYLEDMMKKFEANELEAFKHTYTNILERGAASYRAVFEHLRDRPDEAILVHCTAGKDRAGLFVALFLMLLDVPDADIIADYALSTVGLEPTIPLLIHRFQKIKAYRDNWQGVMRMASSRPENMQMALDLIREKYGGVRPYLINKAGLTAGDLEKIRKNFSV